MTSPRPRPDPAALVVAKAPVPGLVKTRLGAHVGAEAAARVAAAALLDTVASCEAAFGADRCFLALAGDLDDAMDGPALRHRLEGWTVLPQEGDGLAARLVHAHARAAALAGPHTAMVQVGMDTPQAQGDDLLSVAAALTSADAVLGPAHDGGWWALGLAGPRFAVALTGVPMSTATTCRDTHAALVDAGAAVSTGPVLRDVDTPADADHVAGLAPGTRFARCWHDVRADLARVAPESWS